MVQDVFVSHASDDHAVALQVCELLEQRGVRCWIAPRNVSAGAVWDEAILDAIEGTGVFLLILSAGANESSFVKNEVNRAFAEGKPIITFRVEDVMPGRSLQLYLARHHWTDAFPPPVEPHVDQLAASISRLLHPVAAGAPTATSPTPAADTADRKEAGRGPTAPRTAAKRIRFRAWAVPGAILASAFIGGGVTWFLKPAPPSPSVTRLTFPLAEGHGAPMAASHRIAISPDGTQIAYVADGRLYLRSMSAFDARPIPGSELGSDPVDPVFSPDGRSIAFWALSDRTVKRISVTGGAAVTLCPATYTSGMSWGRDGILVALWAEGIVRISANGGTPEALVSLEPGERASGPQMLPDGETVLFTLMSDNGGNTERWDKAKIVAQKVKSRERRILIEGGTDGQYLPTGHVVYVHLGVVSAVAFDTDRLQAIGTPAPVVEGVKQTMSSRTAQFRVSATGTAIYLPGPVSAVTGVVGLGFFDRKGAAEMIRVARGPYDHPRLSPDGKWIAYGSESGVIWIYDLSGKSAARRLTLDGQGVNRHPIWTTDSQRVTFQSDREKDRGIFWQRADGAGTAERLVTAEAGAELIPEAWSPDGSRLLYCARSRDLTSALWTWSVEAKRAEQLGDVMSTKGNLTGAVFSPDGKWVAHASDAGRSKIAVYVQPFPPTGAKYQISKDEDDGHHPIWSPDGRELIFTVGPARPLEIVPISTQPAFAPDEPFPLARQFRTYAPNVPRPYDMSRDGQRFLGLLETQTEGAAGQDREIRVVLNWFEDLKRKVPVR